MKIDQFFKLILGVKTSRLDQNAAHDSLIPTVVGNLYTNCIRDSRASKLPIINYAAVYMYIVKTAYL